MQKNRPDAGAFPKLLKAFNEGPSYWPIDEIQHHAGHCYVAVISDEFVSDLQGRSILMVLENGNSLPLANTRNLDEIINKGNGRYLHVGDKLFFSPSDNASTEVVLSRKYGVLETLVNDQKRIESLMAVNNNESLNNNPALRIVEKLMIYFQDNIQFGGVADLGANNYSFRHVKLDLSQWYLAQWEINKLDIHHSHVLGETLATLKIQDLHIEGVDENFQLDIKIKIDDAYQLIPVSAKVNMNKVSILNVNFSWKSKALKSLVVQSGDVPLMLKQLIASVGGSEKDLQSWVEDFSNDVFNNTFNFDWRMSEKSRVSLMRILNPDAKITAVELVAEQQGRYFQISCEEKSTVEVEL